MPPTTTRSAATPAAEDLNDDGPKYVDLDPRLRNSDNLVAIFSQRRWDGVITFGIHREFKQRGRNGRPDTTTKTAFIPEALVDSYLSFVSVTLDHLKKLQARRALGDLPFPEGGLQNQA